MAPFNIIKEGDFGRLGVIKTKRGDVQTPAMYPVVNLIGGSTTNAGGIWKYLRKELQKEGEHQAFMSQAMGFLDFKVTPDNLNNFWREKALHEHFEIDKPIFMDSGGFKLMNSSKFGEKPESGGDENEWGIYTDPESILELQKDFDADIIATLDYPIPQDLNEDEKEERMKKSIDSAIRCLEMLEEQGDDDTVVYVAIHGHDYEDINWYVAKFLERADSINRDFEGFAVGSLVPIRSNTEMLVDIIQGAKDAIPEEREDEISLHTFGVTGKLMGLLSVLGVDSFDSSTYIQAAKHRNYFDPDTWKRKGINELDSLNCDCKVCESLDLDQMLKVMNSDKTHQKIDDYYKSEFYAKIAHHNYNLYKRELEDIRKAIKNDKLIDRVIRQAEDNKKIKRGLKRATLKDSELKKAIEDREITLDDVEATRENEKANKISLQRQPSDFNAIEAGFEPNGADNLLLIPCSNKKPYSDSRTQKAVMRKISESNQDSNIEKVSISGMYGPVPEKYETKEEVMTYDYVLNNVDEDRIELVRERVEQFLEEYGENYERVIGYAASKPYRNVIEEVLLDRENAEVFPKDLKRRQLTAHFNDSNLNQLRDYLNNLN